MSSKFNPTFCEVSSCASENEPGITYHRFPSDYSRRKEWLKVLGRKQHQLKRFSGVCSRHFSKNDYYPGLNRVFLSAVPTLRLNNDISNKGISSKSKTLQPNGAGDLNLTQNTKDLRRPVTKSSILSANKDFLKRTGTSAGLTKLKTQSQSNEITKRREDGDDSYRKSKSVKVQQALGSDSTVNLRLGSGGSRRISESNTQEISERRTRSRSMSLFNMKNVEYSRSGRRISHSHVGVQSSQRNSISTRLKNKSPLSKTNPKESKHKSSSFSSRYSSKATDNLADSINSVASGCSFNKMSGRKSTSKKRSLEEETPLPESKKQSFKRKRLISTSSDRAKNLTENVHSSGKIQNTIVKEDSTSDAGTSLSNIEQMVFEMKYKIQALERKSILDEKKIETFQKALIEQRKNDIKLFMDEKENELLLRMDLLYLDFDPQRICRLCLLLVERKEVLIPLFRQSTMKEETVAQLIKNATGVQIEPEEGMPCGVCENCLQQIKRIDWIKRRTQRSHVLIKKFLATKKGLTDTHNILPTTSTNFTIEKTEVVEEVLQEEENDSFKIEDVFSLEFSTEGIQFKEEPQPYYEDSAFSVPQDLPVYNFKTRPSKPQKCKGCRAVFINGWSLKNHRKYCKNTFQCSECGKGFWNSHLLKRHKQRTFACQSELSLRYCVDCDIPFRWKYQLLFHIILHSPQSCQLCGIEYLSSTKLKHHVMQAHWIV